MKSLIKLSTVVGYLLVGMVVCILPAQADPTVHSSDYKIEFLANGFGAATGVALSPDGDLYVTDYAPAGRVIRIRAPSSPGSHTAEVYATNMPFSNDLSFAFGGRLFATYGTSQIAEILSNGSAQIFGGTFSFPIGMATFGSYLYVDNGGDGTISRVDSSGASTIFVSGFGGPHGPFGLSFDSVGNLYLRISVIVNSDFADGERARLGFARSEILSVSVHDQQAN